MVKLIATLFLCLACQLRAEPVRIIYDTDMGNDVDDVMALAMIHQLERRGVCKLLACTSSKDHPKSAPFIDAINVYYQNPGVPVGAVRQGVTPAEGRYLGILDKKTSTGSSAYPRKLTSGKVAPDAVALLRKTLADHPDGSVVIVQVGFFTNLAQLLDSKPDKHSALAGSHLVKKKVKELILMAGEFDPRKKDNKHREFNVIMDIPAAQKVAAKWPTNIRWSGFEIGRSLPYPWKSIAEDFGRPTPNLMRESYLAYVRKEGVQNATWDLTCVLHAAYPDRGYFGFSGRGRVSVTDKGITHFKPEKIGRDRFFTMDDKQRIRVLEAFVQLVATPPPNR